MTSEPDTIRVLHVDDEPDFAEMTADFLVRQDDRIGVETATSVVEGLNQLSDENFDCIVSDYDMPERNGIEFLETVREDYPDFPFILFTGKGSEEIASEAISAGVTDYLQKEGGTGQYSVLANRVINAVSRRRTERDLRASEQRYRQLLEAAPVPILLYSENLEVIHANQAAVEFLNAHDREQLIGKHATEFAHPDNEDHVQSRLERIASNWGPIPAAEAKIIAIDGSKKFAIASSIPGTHEGEPVIQTVAYDITQQKEQAANYESIFENTPEGIVLHDAVDGSFIDMNARYVEMFGYESKEEFLAAGFEAIHPDNPRYTLERGAEQVQKAINEGSHTFEWLAVRKDGSQFWAEVHLTPVELHGEQRILAAVRDITERKVREDELRESSRRLTLALDATQTGVWEWNMETDEVSWSESMERLLGIEPGSFDGSYEAHEEFLYPDDIQTVEQAAEEAIQGDGSFDAEFRMVRGDGEIIWVRGRGECFREEGFERMIGTSSDITKRKEREQVIGRRAESLQAVYEIISKGEGSVSEQIDALLAVARNHIGTDFASFSHIDGDQYEFEAVDVAPGIDLEAGESTPLVDLPVCERAFQTGQTLVIGNISAEAPELSDPTWGIECYIGTPVNVGENPYGTFCFYDLKPKSGGFSDWERTFVELLGDWVGSAIHRQETRDRLQRQNERLEAFTGIVSHDLRNPLNVAEGNLVLAREAHDSEQLQAIDRALERMSKLIEDLLTLAREGEALREYESVELGPLVEKCWSLVDTADATMQIEFEGTIQADRSGLEQLIENVIRNAVEHGGDDVKVTVGKLPDGFYIEDDGSGIPPDERDDVLDAGYSTKTDGTGIGLHIVHDIAEAHGWTISVAERSDGGARFEFSAVETA